MYNNDNDEKRNFTKKHNIIDKAFESFEIMFLYVCLIKNMIILCYVHIIYLGSHLPTNANGGVYVGEPHMPNNGGVYIGEPQIPTNGGVYIGEPQLPTNGGVYIGEPQIPTNGGVYIGEPQIPTNGGVYVGEPQIPTNVYNGEPKLPTPGCVYIGEPQTPSPEPYRTNKTQLSLGKLIIPYNFKDNFLLLYQPLERYYNLFKISS